MGNEISVLMSDQSFMGHRFNIYGDKKRPLFLAHDVAELLEYSRSSGGSYNLTTMLGTVDEDEKLLLRLLIAGQHREVLALTKDGLYEVLFQSRMPAAKAFKKKVKELLNTLEEAGVVEIRVKTVEERLAEAYQLAHEVLAKKNTEVKELTQVVEMQESDIQAMKTKADYAEDILALDEKRYTANEVAELFGKGVVIFNRILEGLGIQYKRHARRRWHLAPKYRGMGYAVVQEWTPTDDYEEEVPEGVTLKARTKRKPRPWLYWTATGIAFLRRFFIKHKIEIKSTNHENGWVDPRPNIKDEFSDIPDGPVGPVNVAEVPAVCDIT